MNQEVSLIFIVQLFCTNFMCGLIWFVQVVHYPLFSKVGEQNFVDYEKLHCSKTSYIVVPLMLIELITGFLLLYISNPLPFNYLIVNFMLIVLIWLSTAFIQSPAHIELIRSFSQKVHQNLVRFNWLRTILWSIKSFLLSYLLLPL